MAPVNKPLIIQVAAVQPVGDELLGLFVSNLLYLPQERPSVVPVLGIGNLPRQDEAHLAVYHGEQILYIADYLRPDLVGVPLLPDLRYNGPEQRAGRISTCPTSTP